MGLLGQPGDQDLVCHLIFAQSSFGIYESSCQNAQEAHNLGAINAFLHCIGYSLFLLFLPLKIKIVDYDCVSGTHGVISWYLKSIEDHKKFFIYTNGVERHWY